MTSLQNLQKLEELRYPWSISRVYRPKPYGEGEEDKPFWSSSVPKGTVNKVVASRGVISEYVCSIEYHPQVIAGVAPTIEEAIAKALARIEQNRRRSKLKFED